MTSIKKIHWQGFLKYAVAEFPKEACGILYSTKPYSSVEEWYVFIVKNIADDPLHHWRPDLKEFREIKKTAKARKLTHIGNIHTHPHNPQWEDTRDEAKPSDEDLSFAKRYNDIIRGIIVVDKAVILEYNWHDQFGKTIFISFDKLTL